MVSNADTPLDRSTFHCCWSLTLPVLLNSPVISFTLSQRESYAPSGVKLPSPHDVVTRTSPLHVSFAESVPSDDAEHVVTTTVVATMMLHVKGIVKDIAVDSATGAVDTPLYPVTLPWTLFTVQLKSLQVSFVAV